MKTLNGYEVVDEKARQDIETLKNKQVDVDLTGYATEEWVNNQGFIKEHQSLAEYAKKTDIPDVTAFQTAAQVTALINEALEGIATAEGGSY